MKQQIFEYKINESETLNVVRFYGNLFLSVMRDGLDRAKVQINLFNPTHIDEYEFFEKVNEHAGFKAFKLIDNHIKQDIDDDRLIIEKEATLWGDSNNIVHYFVSNGENKIIEYKNTTEMDAEKLYGLFYEFKNTKIKNEKIFMFLDDGLFAEADECFEKDEDDFVIDASVIFGNA